MSRILRFAEIYHHHDNDVAEGLTTTVAGYTASPVAASLVIPVTHAYVAKTIDGTEALSLADGQPGQVLVINCVARSVGDGTLTPTRLTGFNTIVFNLAGEQAVLMYVDDVIGWIILSVFGLTEQPQVT